MRSGETRREPNTAGGCRQAGRRRVGVGILGLAGACGIATGGAATAAAAADWTLTLADSVVVAAPRLALRDVAIGPLPAAAAQIVIRADGRPGQLLRIDRRGVLRTLVQHGLARGLRLAGADICRVRFAGTTLDEAAVIEQLRRQLLHLLPPTPATAPASWLEIEIPAISYQVAGPWQVELAQPVQPVSRRLAPGRNLIAARIVSGTATWRFSATVHTHIFGEVARVSSARARDTQLSRDAFGWEWIDLCRQPMGLVVGRDSVDGTCAARDLRAGELLREADIKPEPLVRQGDPVELLVTRGQVAVTVRAHARQDGRLGQVISVRNSINGKLVTARVSGPGQVEWRR